MQRQWQDRHTGTLDVPPEWEKLICIQLFILFSLKAGPKKGFKYNCKDKCNCIKECDAKTTRLNCKLLSTVFPLYAFSEDYKSNTPRHRQHLAVLLVTAGLATYHYSEVQQLRRDNAE